MEQKVNDFRMSFCPFRYRDIEKAIEAAEGAGKTIEYAVDAVLEFQEATDTPIDKVDPVYCVYDALYNEARQEIERATGKDIANDEPYSGVNIFANYMCTSFDAKDEDRKALRDLIATMGERSKVVEWLNSEMQ